ncbi:MAG: hypothetical protein H5T44_01330 [Thermoplasmatales archaeon]|nr:hypothetical protein [Thermoplasmatales archaeon]
MKKSLIFVIFLLILLPSEDFNGNKNWEIETIDMQENIGMDTSICIFNEDIFISYYDVERKILKLASFVNGKWGIEIVDSGNVGIYSSIAVDSYGLLHIVYYDANNDSLKYAKKNNFWKIDTLDYGGVGKHASIAISNDIVHVSYYDERNGNLKYARIEGDEKSIEIVDSGNAGIYSSIAVDAFGRPHISYGNVRGKLFYAFLKDGKWIIEEIDKNSVIWESTSIAIDNLSHPHICYYDISRDDVWFLKHAYFDGKKWRVEVIDPDLIGFYNSKGASIAVDSYKRIHVAYFGWKGWDLKYAYFDGEWHLEKVDEEGDVGAYPSIAIDSNGYPHISYTDRSNLDLKYARKINYEPKKPEKSKGKIFAKIGKEFFYETISNDFDGDKIRYGWDWNGDEIVDEWTDFYEPGNKIKISHLWNKPGIYKIKVIAEDEKGFLSKWSEGKIIFVIK